MGVLEEVTNMKSQGMDEATITNSLRERGFSPQQINDAFSQAQIKNAVAQEEMTPPTPQLPTTANSPYTPQTVEAGQSNYTPKPQQEYLPPTHQQYVPQESGDYYPSEQYASSQDYYPLQGDEGYSVGTQTDTMIEVAEQVFFEKIQKLQKQINDLEQFKTLSETKLDSIENRLKKIEAIIDKLQISILNKVGSYARGFDSIKKEMNMIEDSFSKVMSGRAKPAPASATGRVGIPKSNKKKTIKRRSSKSKKK